MNLIYHLNLVILSRAAFLLLIITSILLTSCNYQNKLLPRITQQEAEEVKNICDDIKPPSSFTKKDAKYYVKAENALCLIQYISTEDSVKVEKYFVKLFTSLGWKYQKESRAYANRLIFKKDKFTVSVEVENQSFFSSKEKDTTIACSVGLY